MHVKQDAVAGLICKIQFDILKNYDNCNVLIDAWSLVFCFYRVTLFTLERKLSP